MVTARGFAGLFANKLLVLIDGRSVYTPLFSGVFWETQDTAFEDIDRIEVIRGPGGALWGANAVNGIINIITKDSHETTGTFIQGGGGNEQHPFLTTRYGTSLGSQLALRVFGKYFNGEVGHEFLNRWRVTVTWRDRLGDVIATSAESFLPLVDHPCFRIFPTI